MTECKLEDIPKVLKEVTDLREIFASSVKGDFSIWADAVGRIESYFVEYKDKNRHLEVENEGQKHFIPTLEEEVCKPQSCSQKCPSTEALMCR